MTRLVNIEVTEHYVLEIEDTVERADGTMAPVDGTDAIVTLDELDSDDQAAAYDHRDVKVTDRETGEELPVDPSVV